MKKNKRERIYLREKIGISICIIFVLILFSSIKWATYQQIFQFKITEISGFKILDRQDYFETINKLNIDNHNLNIVEISRALEEIPFVKAARVSRHFPKNFKIQISERKPIGIINIDEQLMIDDEGVILPGGIYSENYLVTVLSGFNSAKELYPEGRKTFSVKVNEAVKILKILSDEYSDLYENISELTLNKDDEYVIILADLPKNLSPKNLVTILSPPSRQQNSRFFIYLPFIYNWFQTHNFLGNLLAISQSCGE